MRPDLSDNLYLLDANAIRQLDFDLIVKAQKSLRLMTLEDVKEEVGGLDKADLIPCSSLDSNAFTKMSELMATERLAQKLANYYENKGAADVAILSYVLTANYGKIIKDKFVVVTEDTDLRKACKKLEIEYLSVSDFRNIIP